MPQISQPARTAPPSRPAPAAPTIATGSRGERANARLIAHGTALGRRVHRVSDRIHCQLGTSLGNATLVRGATGNIQFIYDQTVRGINRGLTPDELVRFVTLPASLSQGRLTGQFDGELPYHVRQVYAGLVGWFGSDTAELHPLAPSDSAARWLELAGGTQRVLDEARGAIAREDFAWAAELATAVRRAQPASEGVRRLKADALRALGQRTTAANTRFWYLTHARELERQLHTRRAPIRFVNATTVQQMPLMTYVRALRFRIDPALSAAAARVVALTIGDQPFTLTLRNGVTLVAPGEPAQPDARLALTPAQWAALVAGALAADSAVAAGVRAEGDPILTAAVLAAAYAGNPDESKPLP
ncbi:MAG: SCP2 sterol-binding domain-containing protein [Proteobacteria bacterium]|nr:SCP2 sterol-binding domain-containing protein [Pseudomonadota bacterium]